MENIISPATVALFLFTLSIVSGKVYHHLSSKKDLKIKADFVKLTQPPKF